MKIYNLKFHLQMVIFNEQYLLVLVWYEQQ